MKRNNRPWAPWEREFVRRTYACARTRDIAQVLSRSEKSVTNQAAAMGLRKPPELRSALQRQAMADPTHRGHQSKFRAGNVPWSSGTHGVVGVHPNCRRTQFRAGSKPASTMPIGATRIVDGTLEVKTSDTPGAYNLRWAPVHRLVWEAAHGPVPPGHVVRFRDGRKTTDRARITIDALEIASRAEHMRRNSIHARLPPELIGLIRSRSWLTRTIRQIAQHHSKETDDEQPTSR
ncbi:MAG TPA: HNH endonuclease signature motif containing protein [Rubrivivax sp.]|nr:HNH endonuclease signature motif containing protein [Rubrivivax sp.]HMR68861.1 HNH endonuclease signature motif containing protein [Rubrivivax sp.]